MEEQIQPQPAPIQPTSVSPIPINQGNKPLTIASVLVFLLMVGGLVYLGYQNYQLQQRLNLLLEQQTTKEEPTPIPSQNETLDWKIYTSTKANYTFNYPSEWPLVNVPTFPECTVCVEDIDFTPKYDPNSGDATIAVILIFKEDRVKSLEDYVNIFVKGDSSKIALKYTTVGEESAVSYKLSGGIPPLPIIEYAVVKNDMYYLIRLVDSIETNKDRSGNLGLFNKMLSTFKFE